MQLGTQRLLLPSAFVSLFLAAIVFGQRDLSDVEIKATKVAGNVYMLEGRGGNIGACVGDDGILLIDDQFLPLADKIEAALAELSKAPLRYLVNTHWHGDHTGGNPHFGRTATIFAHTNVRKRLAGDEDVVGRKNQDFDPIGLPDVTYDDSITMHFNGEEIVVLHFPSGHTDGDSIVFFEGSNVAHLGDLYFQSGFPFIDVDSGGSVAGVISSIEAILASLPDDCRVIPGHGAVTGTDGLREYLTMLHGCRDLVIRDLRLGLSAEEMKQAGVFDRYKDRWEWQFITADKFVDTLVSELSDG